MIHTRINVSTGTAWEPVVGYSRAVRCGPFVWVSGTTATGPDGQLVGKGDAGAQTRQALENIRSALGNAGPRLEHVVRTRIYVPRHRAAGKPSAASTAKCSAAIRPATSMVEVSGLDRSADAGRDRGRRVYP